MKPIANHSLFVKQDAAEKRLCVGVIGPALCHVVYFPNLDPFLEQLQPLVDNTQRPHNTSLLYSQLYCQHHTSHSCYNICMHGAIFAPKKSFCTGLRI
jgi:Fe-S-cluster-containing hydrogenase component 2